MFRNRVCRLKKSFSPILFFSILILISIISTTIDLIKTNHSNEIITRNSSSICPQLTFSSKGCFRVHFTEDFPLNYSLICQSTDHLLVYILSTSKNYLRREAIRRTWANKRVHRQLNSICFVFLVGLSTSNVNIREEALLHGDLIQLNLDETYANVVYKEVGALQWSSHYASHIPYLFKTDDDLIVDSLLLSDIIEYFISNRTDHSLYLQREQLMINFLQDIDHVDKYTLFKGSEMGIIQTFRQGKFRINHLAWNSDRLPPYCSGFGFLYSSFIRDRLYRASLCYANEYVPLVGDVFLSGFLAGAASVRCSRWLLSTAQRRDDCSSLFHEQAQLLVCSTPLHGGRQIYSDFDQAWNVIRQRHFNRSTTTTRISNHSLLNKTENIKVNSIVNVNQTTREFFSNSSQKMI